MKRRSGDEDEAVNREGKHVEGISVEMQRGNQVEYAAVKQNRHQEDEALEKQ